MAIEPQQVEAEIYTEEVKSEPENSDLAAQKRRNWRTVFPAPHVLLTAAIFGTLVGIGRIALAYVFNFALTSTVNMGPFGSVYSGKFNVYTHWDSGWFVNIALHGHYTAQATAFYPGYPLLVKLVFSLIGAKFGIYAVAVIVDWLIFIASLVAIYYATFLIFPGKGGAYVTLAYAFAPASVFSVSAYSEPLTVLLCVVAAIFFFKGRPYVGAAFASFASTTGSVGVVFGASVALAYLIRERKWLRAIRIGAISELGFLSYSGYLWLKFKNPFEELSAQKYWLRHVVFPFAGLFSNIKSIVLGRIHFAPLPLPATNKNMVTTWLIDDGTALVVIFLLLCFMILALRSKSLLGVPLEWVIFAFVATVMVNSTDITTFSTFSSTEALARLLGQIFSLYPIGYAVLKRLWIVAGPIVASLVAMCMLGQALVVLDFWFT